MKDSVCHKTDLLTPAYVYDQGKMKKVLAQLNEIKKQSGCQILYSIKSANVIGLLEFIKSYVDGFSCSSLFEVKLAKEVLGEDQTIHITTPGYREDEWDELITLSDYITLNSLLQWQRVARNISNNSSCGIRINPELSFVKDERYDPCRPASKLGITLNKLNETEGKGELDWLNIEGIHIHNNCESNDLSELFQSINKVITRLEKYMSGIKWINLGGGYLFNEHTDTKELIETINGIKAKYNLDVYLEPGKAITGEAGYLIASVIDLIEADNKTIAILDTSINHLPEVFEYQYQPKVMNAKETGKYEYRLAGASCLSGDLFGDYCFDEPLELGSRIVFENVGAYMQVKANTFNGINLPTTYLLSEQNEVQLLKEHNYDSFHERL